MQKKCKIRFPVQCTGRGDSGKRHPFPSPPWIKYLEGEVGTGERAWAHMERNSGVEHGPGSHISMGMMDWLGYPGSWNSKSFCSVWAWWKNEANGSQDWKQLFCWVNLDVQVSSLLSYQIEKEISIYFKPRYFPYCLVEYSGHPHRGQVSWRKHNQWEVELSLRPSALTMQLSSSIFKMSLWKLEHLITEMS